MSGINWAVQPDMFRNRDCTPGPLYNTVHYNSVLDITLITVGPHLDYFGDMPIHFTLVITRFG